MEDSNQIMLALGRLEGKVDAMLTKQKSQDETLEKHDRRIRTLEQSRSWLLGASAIIGASVSFLMKYLMR
jgi:hypothetical protein